MGRFLSFMTLNEAKIIPIESKGYKWDVEIIDGTHLKYKLHDKDTWAIPLHFNQVDDDMMEELRKKGLVHGNFFKIEKE